MARVIFDFHIDGEESTELQDGRLRHDTQVGVTISIDNINEEKKGLDTVYAFLMRSISKDIIKLVSVEVNRAVTACGGEVAKNKLISKNTECSHGNKTQAH